MPTSDQDVRAEHVKVPDEVPDVSVTQLLLMHNRQERVTLALYNFRILASLGVLGFVYHESEFRYNWIVKTGISVGFILFAFGNGHKDGVGRSWRRPTGHLQLCGTGCA